MTVLASLASLQQAVTDIKTELDAIKAAPPGSVDLTPITNAVAQVQATATDINTKLGTDTPAAPPQ